MPPKSVLTGDGGYPIYSGYRVSGYAKEYLYKEPMLILVARGVGGTGDVKISPPESWITNLSIVMDLADGFEKQYMLYLLNSEDLKSKLNTGAAQAQITIANLGPYRVRTHDHATQLKIVSVISAYDDLIENNRRRIALLEDAARQLYKEWFVRFRFPRHEHVKMVDGLPEGWHRKPLGEVAELVMGQSPQSKFYNFEGSGLPFHQGVTDYGFRFVTHRTYSTKITKLAEPDDILVSVRAPVGRINITFDRIVLGRGLSAIRSKTGNQSFLLYALKEHFYAEDIIGTGAIYAATNKKELEAQLLMLPTEQIIGEFEDISAPIDRQIANLSKSIEHLTKARNLLLPRLMNGTLTV